MGNKRNTLQNAYANIQIRRVQSPQADGVAADEIVPKGDEHYLPFTDIFPDPDQPRRLLPRQLLNDLWGLKITPTEAAVKWREFAKSDPVAKQEMVDMETLVQSLARYGLGMSITIRASGTAPVTGIGNVIVLGERRYWAHVFLHMQQPLIPYGDSSYPSNLVRAVYAPQGVDPQTLQLIENIVRKDLNPVDIARALWNLRYDLSKIPRPPDGNYENLPKLTPWNEIEKVFGYSRQYRYFITSILNLSADAQELVIAHKLPESVVRPVVLKLRDDPELQMVALTRIVEWENSDDETGNRSYAAITRMIDQLLKQKETKSYEPVSKVGTTVHALNFRRNVKRTLRTINKWGDKEWQGVLADIARAEDRPEVYSDTLSLMKKLAQILPMANSDQHQILADIDAILKSIDD